MTTVEKSVRQRIGNGAQKNKLAAGEITSINGTSTKNAHVGHWQWSLAPTLLPNRESECGVEKACVIIAYS